MENIQKRDHSSNYSQSSFSSPKKIRNFDKSKLNLKSEGSDDHETVEDNSEGEEGDDYETAQ